MGPGRQDSILVTLSCLLKSMAPGFPDLEVPPPSLITTNGPLLIKLPNPIILFASNWVYSSGLLNILCWWVAQLHYVLCEGALPLVCFIKLPALTTPGCLLCFTFISFQAEWGLCGTHKALRQQLSGTNFVFPPTQTTEMLLWETHTHH